MKKQIVLVAALIASASLFAEESFKLSGFVRAGLSSTIGEGATLSTKTWYPGIYFSGDSMRTRGRINLSFDGKNDNAKYGAFMRLQYDTKTDDSAKNWNVGDVKYANAYVSLFNNIVTVAGGKLKDNWIGSKGFEGYSLLDGNAGLAIAVTPIKGLTVAGAAVIDNCKNDEAKYELGKKSFVGGVSYNNDYFSAMASYAGWDVMAASLSLNCIDGLKLSTECELETSEKISAQKLIIDEFVQYSGLEGFTFGLLASQKINTAKVAADDDFSYAITPAVSYTLNDLISFSLEGTWSQGVYENAANGYATIVPAIKLSADKTASARIWASISTDTDQEKSCTGVGVIKEF